MFDLPQMEPPTSYSLWSRDRLLGHTELDYVRVYEKHRMGDFHPTELGEKLMPVVTGVARALMGLARTSRHEFTAEDGEREGLSEGYEGIRQTTAYANAAAAQAHQEGLELELRTADGSVVRTEWIDVRDTELLKSVMKEEGREFEDELQGEFAEEFGEEFAEEFAGEFAEEFAEEFDLDDVDPALGERTFPRYQIQVGLFEDSAIP